MRQAHIRPTGRLVLDELIQILQKSTRMALKAIEHVAIRSIETPYPTFLAAGGTNFFVQHCLELLGCEGVRLRKHPRLLFCLFFSRHKLWRRYSADLL